MFSDVRADFVDVIHSATMQAPAALMFGLPDSESVVKVSFDLASKYRVAKEDEEPSDGFLCTLRERVGIN